MVTFIADGTNGNGTTTVTPGIPTCQVGDRLRYVVSTRQGGTIVDSLTALGWTLLSGMPVTGGSATIAIWAKDADAADVAAAGTAGPTVSITSGNVSQGKISSYRPAGGMTVDTAVITSGADTSSGTGVSCAGSSITTPSGSMLTCVTALVGTNPTAGSSRSITQAGATLGTQTNRWTFVNTSGNDLRTEGNDRDVTTGATGVPTLTMTSSTVTALTVFIVLIDVASTTPVAGTETGAGADAMSAISAALAGTDAGSGVDVKSALTATGSGSDTGAGVDAGAIAASMAGTDAAAGADAKTALTAALSGSDSASGADAMSALTATAAGADSGTGADAASLATQATGSDAAAGTDAGTVVVAVSGSDAATAVDATSSLDTGATAKAGSDTASATESATVTVVLSGTDAATSVDAATLAVSFTRTDTATCADAGSITALLQRTDAASATELGLIAAAVAGSDLAGSTEGGTVTEPTAPPMTPVGARSTGRLIEPGTGHISTPAARGRLLGPDSARFLTAALEGDLL